MGMIPQCAGYEIDLTIGDVQEDHWPNATDTPLETRAYGARWSPPFKILATAMLPPFTDRPPIFGQSTRGQLCDGPEVPVLPHAWEYSRKCELCRCASSKSLETEALYSSVEVVCKAPCSGGSPESVCLMGTTDVHVKYLHYLSQEINITDTFPAWTNDQLYRRGKGSDAFFRFPELQVKEGDKRAFTECCRSDQSRLLHTKDAPLVLLAMYSHGASRTMLKETYERDGWVEHGRLPTGHNPSEASILRNKATCLYHPMPSTISGATSLFDARTELIKKHPSEKTPKHDLGPSRDVSHPTFEPCVPGGDLSMTVRKSTDYVEPMTDACGSPQWKPADPEDIKPFGSVHNEVPLLILNARKYQPQARNDEPSAGRRWRFRPPTTAVQDSYGIAQVKFVRTRQDRHVLKHTVVPAMHGLARGAGVVTGIVAPREHPISIPRPYNGAYGVVNVNKRRGRKSINALLGYYTSCLYTSHGEDFLHHEAGQVPVSRGKTHTEVPEESY
ncbi:hypothetical protein Bbelb_021940 [Branchiostoma belcheri]|nr:hypothetical protein Bbelb_021940 [Branchiostoma belcheri]